MGVQDWESSFGDMGKVCKSASFIYHPVQKEKQMNFLLPLGEKGVKGLQSRQDNHYTMLLISVILEITISKTTLFSLPTNLTHNTQWNLCAILLSMTYVTCGHTAPLWKNEGPQAFSLLMFGSRKWGIILLLSFWGLRSTKSFSGVEYLSTLVNIMQPR